MNKMVVKGRERLIRGKLNSFSELPIEKQNIFKKIKEAINKHINCDVHIFGSYNHGYWDEESDYDVVVFNQNYIDISNLIREEVGVKIDIMFARDNVGYIAIP